MIDRRNCERVYLSIGSNVGDRLENLRSCVRMLEGSKFVALDKVSGVYKTAPVGYEHQPDFLNAVVSLDTTLSPRALLDLCQAIERNLGRTRTIRWGPRTIDVDILVYGEEKINEPDLVIPHPRIYERGFVLFPLKEIEPEFIFPDGNHIDKIIGSLAPHQRVVRLDGISLV